MQDKRQEVTEKLSELSNHLLDYGAANLNKNSPHYVQFRTLVGEGVGEAIEAIPATPHLPVVPQH